MTIILALFVGFYLGFYLGIIAASLCRAAADGDERQRRVN